MALTGALVTFCLAYKVGDATIIQPVWSENVALGGKTSLKALATDQSNIGLFRIKAGTAAECYASRGPKADASKAKSTIRDEARVHLSGGGSIDLPATVDDIVSIEAA